MSEKEKLFQLNLSRMGESRRAMLAHFAGAHPTEEDNRKLTRFIESLRYVIETRQRTEVRGLGVFTWRPFKAHLPDGRKTVTKRLWFNSQCIRRGR